jgi:hypothetical protein
VAAPDVPQREPDDPPDEQVEEDHEGDPQDEQHLLDHQPPFV